MDNSRPPLEQAPIGAHAVGEVNLPQDAVGGTAINPQHARLCLCCTERHPIAAVRSESIIRLINAAAGGPLRPHYPLSDYPHGG
jgi:hypothetical protein